MKSRKLMCIQAIVLVAALAIPAGLAAQDNQGETSNHKHHHYKFIDLGTFGGPQSWVNGAFEFPAATLNNAGTVVGVADTPNSNPNYPNCNPFLGCPDPFVEHAFQWHDGDLTDLGVLQGGYNSSALWISSNGLVAGGSENGLIDPVNGYPEIRAVLWKDGQIKDIGTLGGTESLASSVNTRGQVAGGSFDASNNTRAFLWTEDQGLQDLGTLGGASAIGGTINERGQISGESALCDTCNQDAFLWEDGKMYRIPDFGGPTSFHNDLNNRGQVVGQSDLPGGANAHAFLWDKKNGVTDLGTLGGSGSVARWINDAGDVVGGASTPNDQAFHATLWRHRHLKIIDLGTVDGDACSVAQSINSESQVVGLSDMKCDGTVLHAFLWENGGPAVDLNTFVPPGSGPQLTQATSINDRGEIAGQATTSNGDNHAFLLIPCDDKHTDGEGCDYSPVDATTVPQTQPAAHQTSGLMLSPIVTQRTSWYRHIASSRNTGNGLADDMLEGVPSLKRPPPPIYGYCQLNTANNNLDGLCIGATGLHCVAKYNPAQCPPGKKAKAPGNFSCAIGQVTRIDGATSCQAH
jgi:probable HAF family extracellular repeat protein